MLPHARVLMILEEDRKSPSTIRLVEMLKLDIDRILKFSRALLRLTVSEEYS